MRIRSHIALFFTLMFLSCNCNAQTLTEKLVAENPQALITDARESGDIVRGAILFHQGNINCAKCHRPASEKDRIGPDLSRLKPDITDEQIVKSILLPSAAISEGYETIIALTDSGESFSGIVVEENAERIVIRDAQDIDKLITLPRDELEGLRAGKVSTMPDGLMNELLNRQQFLDLLRYVLDIKERGPIGSIAQNGSAQRKELSPELSGLVLLQKHNCIACHESPIPQSSFAAKQPPHLKWSAKHLNPEYLAKFIAAPHAIKPGTTMPDMFTEIEESKRETAATAISAFLTTTFANEYRAESVETSGIENGHEIFHSTGCVACHSPRDLKGVEQAIPDSEPLGDLSQKYSSRSLIEFLKDPHSVRPSGRMPNMKLTHFEATDISSFLLQGPVTAEPSNAPVPRNLIEQGKELFTSLNCAACHKEVVSDPKVLSKPLADLNPENGCLSGANGNWPSFNFSEKDLNDLQSAIGQQPLTLSNEQQIIASLNYFNCSKCHQRGDYGGISDLRNPHFQTTDMNLGEQGRVPPTLTGVGAKLKRDWLRDVFVNRRSIRPYMKTRMPQYGEDNIGYLVELFQSTDKLPTTKFAAFDDQKKMRETGHQLAGNKGLNCVACHTFQYKVSDTMPAVDMTEMSERLKKDWFYQYMLDPQRFSPNTVMPSFWPGGQPIRTDLEGTPELQVEAIWQYLLDGRQARVPSGVVRERLEIVVSDEAQMLRRSYPGIGKRGIGVGYPGGVNLVFDAEQLRLGMIWKGKFLDPGGVWTGQGSGTARPMGNPINFEKGPQLDDLEQPWVVDDGRPPKHQFRGYQLDQQQRPTFRYDFEDVSAEDFIEQIKDKNSGKTFLRRTISLQSTTDHESLSFRVAESASSTENDNEFQVGERLTVRVTSEHSVRVSENADKKRLRIVFDLVANEKQSLVIEYRWD